MFLANKLNKGAGVPTPVDAQFNYVTMLLHGDGTNGAQNNTFLDSSTNNFTIEIGDKVFTSEEIGKLIELVSELVNINSDLNAAIIAMNAKLENEEKKVVNLSQRLAQMSLMFTNKTYEA